MDSAPRLRRHCQALLLVVTTKPRSEIFHFAPEVVSNARNRSSKPLRDFIPVVARVSQRQDGAVRLAQMSCDVFQFQLCVHLAIPTKVDDKTGEFDGAASKLQTPGPRGQSTKCAREGQQEQSVFWA